MAVSVTLMEAYMIETLLASGMEKADLIHAIKTEDLDAILQVDDSFDYLAFIKEAKDDFERVEQAIQSGYTIKFISVYGIERLLNIKFALESGKDYSLEDHQFHGIKLKQDEFTDFETMLSPNWNITNKKTTNTKVTFDIIHQTHSPS